jgi:hypothetical protein
MPIRTLTLEAAAENFIIHYQAHLAPSSPINHIDPRQCPACQNAFEDLIFTYEGQRDEQLIDRYHKVLKVVPGDLKFKITFQP